MVRSPLFRLTVFLFAVFGIASAGLIFILIKKLTGPIATKFVIGYLIFLLAFFLYLAVITILGMKKLKRSSIKKRLCTFVVWFAGLGIFTCLFDVIFQRPIKGLFEVLDVPFGLALGIAFMDLLFYRDKTE